MSVTKYMFFLCLFFTSYLCSSESFTPYKHIFNQNMHMYKHYLSTSGDLDSLGELHLWSLRFLIDARLKLEKEAYLDAIIIHEIQAGNEYLEKEFVTRYSINHAELMHDFDYN